MAFINTKDLSPAAREAIAAVRADERRRKRAELQGEKQGVLKMTDAATSGRTRPADLGTGVAEKAKQETEPEVDAGAASIYTAFDALPFEQTKDLFQKAIGDATDEVYRIQTQGELPAPRRGPDRAGPAQA